jgi:hypothetical protein
MYLIFYFDGYVPLFALLLIYAFFYNVRCKIDVYFIYVSFSKPWCTVYSLLRMKRTHNSNKYQITFI